MGSFRYEGESRESVFASLRRDGTGLNVYCGEEGLGKQALHFDNQAHNIKSVAWKREAGSNLLVLGDLSLWDVESNKCIVRGVGKEEAKRMRPRVEFTGESGSNVCCYQTKAGTVEMMDLRVGDNGTNVRQAVGQCHFTEKALRSFSAHPHTREIAIGATDGVTVWDYRMQQTRDVTKRSCDAVKELQDVGWTADGSGICALYLCNEGRVEFGEVYENTHWSAGSAIVTRFAYTPRVVNEPGRSDLQSQLSVSRDGLFYAVASRGASNEVLFFDAKKPRFPKETLDYTAHSRPGNSLLVDSVCWSDNSKKCAIMFTNLTFIMKKDLQQ